MDNKNVVLFVGGLIFGFGLAWGGMAKPEIVIDFLQLEDYGLVLLMGAATATTFVAINIVPRFVEKPILGGGVQAKDQGFQQEHRPRGHHFRRRVGDIGAVPRLRAIQPWDRKPARVDRHNLHVRRGLRDGKVLRLAS